MHIKQITVRKESPSVGVLTLIVTLFDEAIEAYYDDLLIMQPIFELNLEHAFDILEGSITETDDNPQALYHEKILPTVEGKVGLQIIGYLKASVTDTAVAEIAEGLLAMLDL